MRYNEPVIADTMVDLEAPGFCFAPLTGQPLVGVGSRDQGSFAFLTGLPAIFGLIRWVGKSRESALPNGVSLSKRSGLPELTEVEEAANPGRCARPQRVCKALNSTSTGGV